MCIDSDERQDLCLDVGVARLSSNTNTNIPGAAYGTVLVKFQQEWSTICSDSFTLEDTKVILGSCQGNLWDDETTKTYKNLGQKSVKAIWD